MTIPMILSFAAGFLVTFVLIYTTAPSPKKEKSSYTGSLFQCEHLFMAVIEEVDYNYYQCTTCKKVAFYQAELLEDGKKAAMLNDVLWAKKRNETLPR
jgi:hypothetical protein